MDSMRQYQKARIVARVRGSAAADQDFSDLFEAETPLITVRRPDEVTGDKVSLLIAGDQKNSGKHSNYQVDELYKQDVSNREIFDREIKPLISSVFEGRHATIFAYGARNSGKTYTIQGSEDEPGMAGLSITEILSRAEEKGNLISISLYEVHGDHVFDLLNSERPEVSILEDASGKITLKGLSKVPIKSITEFDMLYFDGEATGCKPVQKMVNQLPRRAHRGLILYVSHENSDAKLVCQMNLVDLAGFEDSRRLTNDTIDHPDITRTNKSLYAIHKVVCALNSNETRVPYRESKITRMLQDSLQDVNNILMITCMSPSLTEDTIKTLSIASQTCQSASQYNLQSTGKVKTTVKTIVVASPRPMKPINKSVSSIPSGRPISINKSVSGPFSPKPMPVNNSVSAKFSSRPAPISKSGYGTFLPRPTPISKPGSSAFSPRPMPINKSVTAKKGAGSLYHSSGKKLKDTEVKGRRISDETKEFSNCKQVTSSFNEQTNISQELLTEQIKSSLCISKETELSQKLSSEETISSFSFSKEAEISQEVPTEEIRSSVRNKTELSQKLSTEEIKSSGTIYKETEISQELLTEEESEVTKDNSAKDKESYNLQANDMTSTETFHQADKENNNLQAKEIASLDSFHREDKENKMQAKEMTSPPLSARLHELSNNLKSVLSSTRSDIQKIQGNDISCTNVASSSQGFNMSSFGVKKDALVQQCLTFLNTASKEDLKKLKGISERRANTIMELRDESPVPFKTVDDLKNVPGLTNKQIKDIIWNSADFF